jgi:acyl-CoA reductase-like NAD-dependent aldehyde dehydrogenase
MRRPGTLLRGSIVARPPRGRVSVPIHADALSMAASLTLLPPVPAARALSPEVLARLERRLRGDEERLILRMAAETGYMPGECQSLLAASRRFLHHLRALPELHASLVAAETDRYAALTGRSARVELAPWGTCLVCIPASAPAPLGLALPLALVAGGNRVAVAASAGARGTALGLAAMVAEEVGGVALWGGRVRDAAAGLLATGSIDLVYFAGTASPYASLAADCARAGVELIFEGDTTGIAVLDTLDPETWKPVVDALVSAKTCFQGRLAAAPSAIAVPRGLAGEFEAAWARSIRGLHPDRAPRLVREASLDRALEADMAGPIAHLVEYDDWDVLAVELGRARRRLQLSLFSPSDEKVRRMMGATRFARYSVNQSPVERDPVLPWGQYGLSGHADVVDLYRKGLRRIAVERGTLLSH